MQQRALSSIDDRLIEEAVGREDGQEWYEQRLTLAKSWLERGKWRSEYVRPLDMAQRFFDGVSSPYALEEEEEQRQAALRAESIRRDNAFDKVLRAFGKRVCRSENRDTGEISAFSAVSQARQKNRRATPAELIRQLIARNGQLIEDLEDQELLYNHYAMRKSEWDKKEAQRLLDELLARWTVEYKAVYGQSYSQEYGHSEDNRNTAKDASSHCRIPKELHSDFHACIAWCRAFYAAERAALETLLAAVEQVD